MIIGVIGVGVVGKAVLDAFSTKFETLAYDINGNYNELEQLCKCAIIFVCVPSPTRKSTKMQDLTALHNTLQSLEDMGFGGVVCIKCTLLPSTCDDLKKKYKLRITHNPEFLTAAKPYEDFMNQTRVLISGERKDTSLVMTAYEGILPKSLFSIAEDFKTTEMAKYMHNCFLATKVSFFNDIFDLCQSLGIDYDNAVGFSKSQGGLGNTHLKVAPDGMRGYSGACFPKDMLALLTFAKNKGVQLPLIETAIETNNVRRPDSLDHLK